MTIAAWLSIVWQAWSLDRLPQHQSSYVDITDQCRSANFYFIDKKDQDDTVNSNTQHASLLKHEGVWKPVSILIVTQM